MQGEYPSLAALQNLSRQRVEGGLLGGVTTIRGGGITLIPYYAWSHRGAGEMNVWLQRA